jgi:ATP-dependent RNA helicase DeaD
VAVAAAGPDAIAAEPGAAVAEPTGAEAAVQPVRARPKRHSKPHDAERDGGHGPLRKVIIAGGRADGVEPRDVVHALTGPADLDGEAVRNVVVLEHYAFAEVPAREADRVLRAASGVELHGRPLRLELVRG